LITKAIIDLALDEDLLADTQAVSNQSVHQTSATDSKNTSSSATVDLTGSLLDARTVELTLGSRADGIYVGAEIAPLILARVAERLGRPLPSWDPITKDGDAVTKGSVIARLRGELPTLLAAERTLLNFLCHLSGIATLTRSYVNTVSGTRAIIRDTRKTTPGLRMLEKYAVRCGGGSNHRLGLWDAFLIKDNHLAFAPMAELVSRARQHRPVRPLEVEVDNLEQLRECLDLDVDLILLDNMPLSMIKEAVRLSAGRCQLEVSGGVGLDNLRAIAETGVDYIAVGALTHSSPILDLGLDYPNL
jgi:nicotinate-nucleotide pyrophosphorylase (carboxylating)